MPAGEYSSPKLVLWGRVCDLPMAFPSGELRQDVWDRWLSFDPVVNWRDRVDNLIQLRGILLDAGQKDVERDRGWLPLPRATHHV